MSIQKKHYKFTPNEHIWNIFLSTLRTYEKPIKIYEAINRIVSYEGFSESHPSLSELFTKPYPKKYISWGGANEKNNLKDPINQHLTPENYLKIKKFCESSGYTKNELICRMIYDYCVNYPSQTISLTRHFIGFIPMGRKNFNSPTVKQKYYEWIDVLEDFEDLYLKNINESKKRYQILNKEKFDKVIEFNKTAFSSIQEQRITAPSLDFKVNIGIVDYNIYRELSKYS